MSTCRRRPISGRYLPVNGVIPVEWRCTVSWPGSPDSWLWLLWEQCKEGCCYIPVGSKAQPSWHTWSLLTKGRPGSLELRGMQATWETPSLPGLLIPAVEALEGFDDWLRMAHPILECSHSSSNTLTFLSPPRMFQSQKEKGFIGNVTLFPCSILGPVLSP